MKIAGQSIAVLWETRSLREQFLLLVLGVLFVAFVAWYGIASPLRTAAANADAHRARAAQQLADVETAVSEIAGAQGVAALPDGGIGEAVTASAIASGIVLDRDRIENAREVTIWANAVDPAALFSWIRILQQAHGVVVANLTATRDEDGALDVELRFSGIGP